MLRKHKTSQNFNASETSQDYVEIKFLNFKYQLKHNNYFESKIIINKIY